MKTRAGMRGQIESFQRLPLRRQLSMLIALCAGLTALLCMAAVVGTGWWQQQAQAREDTTEIARTLSYALQAPVAFEDSAGMTDALGILRGRPQISGAWVYDARGRLLARYGSGTPVAPGTHGGGLQTGTLSASEPVVVDGRVVGTVTLVNQLSRLWRSLLVALLAVVACSIVGFAISVWLAQRLARGITRPIIRLARTSRAIAASTDYAERLPPGGADEVGVAVAAFNHMLDEIGARGAALQQANRELEQRVADRTLALQREKERAESASVAKTRFLANMSHELRTPLNAVIGAAQLLQSHDAGAAAPSHLVEAIRSSGLSLLGLIENILDVSRIETGALELSPEDFNLLDCVDAAIATAAVPARIKGLQMACIADPALAGWRHGDPLRLRQILLNLLGNAVKFTLEGEVVLRVGPGAAPDAVRIVVSDTGIGISEASLPHVFEPFRQADEGANRRFGGSGLGLAIVHQLVVAMGGRVVANSVLGQGSVFEVELPLPVARQPHPEPAPLGEMVVYFEPHEASAQALAALLARLGCDAHRCRSPEDLRAWLAGPGADGGADQAWLLAATDGVETWNALEDSLSRLDLQRVIGMTRHDLPTLETARGQLRMARNLIKPVLRSALACRLGASGDSRSGELAAASGQTVPPAPPKHVLVVEDDLLNQTIVCAMLHNAGHRTSTARDGASALDQIGRERFDMVLMDWQMPDMDGLEVTRRLRAGAVGRSGKVVPIVALTANAFAEDRAACLAAGMNDFLTKPVLAASLEGAVLRWTAATPPRAPAPASLARQPG
ncbi:MAG: ATP-binding protein [Burkholderiaceae bacterium]